MFGNFKNSSCFLFDEKFLYVVLQPVSNVLLLGILRSIGSFIFGLVECGRLKKNQCCIFNAAYIYYSPYSIQNVYIPTQFENEAERRPRK